MKITHFADTAAASSSGSAPSGPAGGDNSGSYPNPVVVGLQGRPVCTTAPTSGQLLTWDGTQWCPATPAAGTGFATPAIVLGSAAAAGSATTVIRSDSTIAAFDATVPTTSAVGDAAVTGSVAFAAHRDHRHGRESFATPAIVLGTAAAAGAATTLIRSDATIVAFGTAVPLEDSGTGATGSAALASKEDHVHPLSAGGHAHVVSETHLSDGATTTYTLDETFEPGSVIAWNTTTLARLGVTETQPDQAVVSAAGTLGDSIMFDYAATLA